jgi:tetratricopeptide (TPR) repeat protein
MSEKVDVIKLHKDANALMESGKYSEARDLFAKVADLYYKNQNYFGSAEMNYKAGECSSQLKEYEKAVEFFKKSADVSFAKGFERYGLSALENARDSLKALGNTKEADEINTKIAEVKKKLEPPEEESSFSVFG